LKGSLTTLGATLASVTDATTAEKAKSTLEGLVTTLKTQMADVARLGTLSAAQATQKTELLKPVLDKITSLLGDAAIKEKIGALLGQLQEVLK
jgi:hypothetical protein